MVAHLRAGWSNNLSGRNSGDKMTPIEIDAERVHRSRELSVLRLGQPRVFV
jgi:hypothetical protein